MISGGNTIVGSGAIAIDGLRSVDPDGDPGNLTYSWSCATASSSGPCLAAGGGAPISLRAVTSPSLTLQLQGAAGPGGKNHTITLTVSKGDRSSSASVWLSVIAGKVLPTITIVGVTAAKFNPSDKLTLLASVMASGADTPATTEWSVVEPPELVDLLTRPGVAATAATSQSLVLNPNALPARSTVVFRLKATAGDGGEASADVAVPVSGKPVGTRGRTLGDCSVTPRQGKGLNTTFNVTAGNWTDPDLPLAYSFTYEVVGVAGSGRVPIQDFQPASATSFLLPAGDPAGGYVIRVFCLVVNAFGAVAESAPTEVTVNWDEALLANPAQQASLVSAQAATASILVRWPHRRPD